MAKIWQISDGRSYVVNGDPGTTITYTNSTSNGTAAGKQAASIPTGATSVIFPSNGAEVEISSDTATIDQVFNAAAAGLGSSSGGSGSEGGVTFEIVTTLPEQGEEGVIYLVKVSETGDDKFEEWIWVDSAWESIGMTAVDPTAYAKLVGGNTFEGDQIINGSLTVTGDTTGVTESSYNVVETAETTITPTGGTWLRYTGAETALTVAEPEWSGEVEISYLETTTPVDLQGVTWSPAKPTLTGDGPFVYTLVHSKEGEVLAGAYGYSTPTAEAIQAVAPIAWGEFTPIKTTSFRWGAIAIGSTTQSDNIASVALGDSSKARAYCSIAIGYSADAQAITSTSIGFSSIATKDNAIALGSRVFAYNTNALTIGAAFTETTPDGNVTHTCTTEGTGSITIGAGANTLNTTATDGTVTESSNAVTIGCKAENKGADSVVIGASSTNKSIGTVVIGAGATQTGSISVAVGKEANAAYGSASIGQKASTIHASVAIGSDAYGHSQCVGIGYQAKARGTGVIAIGSGANVTTAGLINSDNTTVIGYNTTASAPNALTFGAQFDETVDGSTVTHTCTTEGTGSITIGAGANTLNSTKTVDGVETTVESSNSVTIGCKASNTGADSVVIGAQAKVSGTNTVGSIVIGAEAKSFDAHGISIGRSSSAQKSDAVAIGRGTSAKGQRSIALGYNSSIGAYNDYSLALGAAASTNEKNAIAIGASATAADLGATVIRSTAEDGTYTQLYFSGANTPLANTYENGEAMMGYVVRDSAGNVMTDAEGNAMVGTQKLSVLFPNNRGENAFTPATLGLDDEYTPKPMFRPSDLNLPVEEPTEEEYTPLPVYPIVEPEDTTANSPETESYTPLPVYPIVEPEVPEMEE